MKVTKILPLTYSFDNGNVRFFLLIGKEKALLIDSGDGEENVREVFSEYTDLPLILANTHIGNNHIGGNEYFPFFYLSPSDSFLFYNIYKRRGVIKPLYDGDVISLGDRDVEVISLSGHTPGSVVFLDKETGSIFSGDSISSSPVSFFSQYSDINIYIESLKRLRLRSGSFDSIFPSHGKEMLSRSIINDEIALSERVLHGEKSSDDTSFNDGRILYKDKNVEILR